MPRQPLQDESFSRSGGAVAALFSAAPFAALGGATMLAPLAALAGLLAAPWPRLMRAAGTGGVPLALFAAFLIWAGVSLAWSPHRDVWALIPLLAAATLVLLALGAGLARPADIEIVRRAGIAAVVLLTVLVMVETAFECPIARALSPDGAADSEAGAGLEMTRRGAALAGLWIWGAAAMLAPYRWPGWVITGALAAGAAWIGVHLPYTFLLVALGAGLVPALAAFVWPRGAVAITAMIIAVLTVAAPSIMASLAALSAQAYRDYAQVDPSFPWLARVDTWSFTAGLIRERLAIGWGLGSAPTFTDVHSLAGFSTPYIPGHPQNLAMHIWLETGAIGAILAAAALATFGRRAGAALAGDRWAAAAACGTMTTAFIIASAGISAWALWWWAGLAIAAALVRAARTAP
jgi:hypothetical protein